MKSVLNLPTILFVVAFFFAYFLYANSIMSLILLAFWIYEVILAVRNIQHNITLLLYWFAFFTFLMGRLIFPAIIDILDYLDVAQSFYSFSDATNRHVCLSYFLSILFIGTSYRYFFNRNIDAVFVESPKFDVNSPRNLFIQKYSKYFVYITSPFAFLVIIDKIRYVLQYGYSGINIEYESSLSSVIIMLAALFEYFTFLYLVTFPLKEEARSVIWLYALLALSNLIGGDRGECMMCLCVLLFYYFMRNRICPEEDAWMSTKKILYILVLSPFAFSLLFAINYIRDKQDVEGGESNSMVVSFFLQQSVSMNVVACTYDEIEKLPQNKLYSLGPLYDYVRNNYLSRIVFGTTPYKVGSTELVEKGHSLDSAITSIVLPYSFSIGKGMGSSYIAEAWYDFGYFGIVIYSILYGFILCAIPRLCAKNVWWGVIGLVFLKYILYSPRARTTTFLSQALSVSFWPLALVIHLISLTKPDYLDYNKLVDE